MTFKKGIWKDCFLPRAELLVGLYWVAGYHYYFYIGNAFLTSISKGPEATLWIFHCNAVVSYVNDFINVSWKWNWFMQINLSHSLQDEKYKKWWNRLRSIIGFHLKGRASLGESALSSTRGRKGAIANIFRSNTIGGGHLSS